MLEIKAAAHDPECAQDRRQSERFAARSDRQLRGSSAGRAHISDRASSAGERVDIILWSPILLRSSSTRSRRRRSARSSSTRKSIRWNDCRSDEENLAIAIRTQWAEPSASPPSSTGWNLNLMVFEAVAGEAKDRVEHSADLFIEKLDMFDQDVATSWMPGGLQLARSCLCSTRQVRRIESFDEAQSTRSCAVAPAMHC